MQENKTRLIFFIYFFYFIFSFFIFFYSKKIFPNLPHIYVEVTMETGESVSKERITKLAKDVISSATNNPFKAAPTFTMEVQDDEKSDGVKVRVESLKNGKTNVNDRKRSASDIVEDGSGLESNEAKKQRLFSDL